MVNSIGLPPAIRMSLLNLNQNVRIQARTEERLTTGLRINEAQDDPLGFFRYHEFKDRAQDFLDLKFGMSQGIKALSTVVEVTDGVKNLLDQIEGLLFTMRSASTNERLSFNGQFKEIMHQVGLLINDGEYNSLRLLDDTNSHLRVNFGMHSFDQLLVTGINLLQTNAANSNNLSTRLFSIDIFGRKHDVLHGRSGVFMSAILGGVFSSFTAIGSNNSLLSLATDATTILQKATRRLELHSARLAVQVDLLQRRTEFSDTIATTFNGEASRISAADLAEEGAINLAARTRYDLSLQTVSLFNRRYEQILPLLR